MTACVDNLQPAPEPSGQRTCPQCGIRFRCGAEAGEGRCWCAGFPVVAIDVALPGCLCPACLEERAEGSAGKHPTRAELDLAGLAGIPASVIDIDILIGEPRRQEA